MLIQVIDFGQWCARILDSDQRFHYNVIKYSLTCQGELIDHS